MTAIILEDYELQDIYFLNLRISNVCEQLF